MPLGFKFPNIPFPTPTFPFVFLTFPRLACLQLAQAPGLEPTLSSLSGPHSVCFRLLHHAGSFPSPLAFTHGLAGKPRKGQLRGFCAPEAAPHALVREVTTCLPPLASPAPGCALGFPDSLLWGCCQSVFGQKNCSIMWVLIYKEKPRRLAM